MKKVANNLYDLLLSYSNLLEKNDLSRDSINYQKRLNFERNFVLSVIIRLNRLLLDYPEAVILWDIDGVIGRNNQNVDDRLNVEFEIRPSLPLLFFRIKEVYPKCIFGVITSGTQKHLEKVIFNADLHSRKIDIQKYFDSNFLFSVNSMSISYFDENYPEEYDKFFHGDEMKYEGLKGYANNSGTNMDKIKSMRIIMLEKQYPNSKIIPIDDLIYADYLDGITIKNNEVYYSLFTSVLKFIKF